MCRTRWSTTRCCAGPPKSRRSATCRACASDTVGAYALSEAGSGSDAFALQCRAELKGERIRPQRPEAVDHQRQGSRRLHSARDGRSRRGLQRHHRVHRREKFPRLYRRQERRQAGHPRLQHLRADSGRLPRAQGERAGRGRQGLQDRHRNAERRPHRHRRADARPGARRVGVRGEVRAGAQAVRQAHRRVSRAFSSRSRRWPPRSRPRACCSTTAPA